MPVSPVVDLNDLNGYISSVVHGIEFFWTVLLGLTVAVVGWVFAQKKPMANHRAILLTVGLAFFFFVSFWGLVENMQRLSIATDARAAFIQNDPEFLQNHGPEKTPENMTRFYTFLANDRPAGSEVVLTYVSYWMFAALLIVVVWSNSIGIQSKLVKTDDAASTETEDT